MRRESVRRRWFVSLCSSGRDTETVAAHSSSVLERRCACGCESPPRARRPSLRRQKRDARPQPGADGPRRSPRTYAPQDARDRSYLVSAYRAWSPPACRGGGDVPAPARPHPSASPQIDRSALKVGFRCENAAGAADDPSGDASSFLCSPMRREATRGCSARHGRRRLRRARVGRSGGTLCARHLPAPRRQPSRHR